jgi:hypothetical protein
MRTISRLVAITLFASGLACHSDEAWEQPAIEAASVVEEVPVKRELVRADPRLLALVEEEDPDLRDLTDEEIKAELARAKERSGQSAFQEITLPPPSGGANWKQLEEQKKRRGEQWEAYLDRAVTVGPDGMYHLGNCAALWTEEWDPRALRTRRVYRGSASTLRAASGSPHGACGAPTKRRVVID